MFNNKKSIMERGMFNQGDHVDGAPRIQGLQNGGMYYVNISDLERMSIMSRNDIPRVYSPTMPVGGSPVMQQVFQIMSGPNMNPSITPRQPLPHEIANAAAFNPLGMQSINPINHNRNMTYDIYKSDASVVVSKNHKLSDLISYNKALEIVKKMIKTTPNNGSINLLTVAKNKLRNYAIQKDILDDEIVYSIAVTILNNLLSNYISSEDMESNENIRFELRFSNPSNEINGYSADTLLNLCVSYESNNRIITSIGCTLGMNFITSKIFLDAFNGVSVYPILHKHNFMDFKISQEYVEKIVDINSVFFTSLSKNIDLIKVSKKIYESIIKELNNGPIQSLLSINVWVNYNLHGERLWNISITYVSTERSVSSIIIPVDEEIMKSEDNEKFKECTSEEDGFVPVIFSSICYRNLKRDFNMFMSFMDFTIESYNSNEEGFKEIFKNIISDYDSIERFALDASVELMGTVYAMIRSLNIDGFLRFTIKFDGNRLSLVVIDKVTGVEYNEIDLIGLNLEKGICGYRKSYIECDQFDISSINNSNGNYSLMSKEDAMVELIKNIILHDMEAYSKIYKIFSSLNGYCDGNIFESVNDIANYILEYGTINDVFDVLHKTYTKLNSLIISIKDKSINVELMDVKGDTYKMCIFEYKELFITEELVSDIIDSKSNNSLDDVINKIYELASINGIIDRDHKSIREALKKSIYSTIVNQDDRDWNVEGYIINNYLNQYINEIDYELGNDGLIKVTFRPTSADLESYVRTISVYHVLLLMKQN